MHVYSHALELVWYEYVLVLVCILVYMVVYSVYSLNYIFFLVHVPNAYFLLFFKCFLRILTRIGSVHIQRPSESGHIFGMRIRIQIKGHIAPVYCQTVPGVFKLAPNAINIRYIPVLTVSFQEVENKLIKFQASLRNSQDPNSYETNADTKQ